jgi:predicted GNAT family acetyltransferase
MPTDNENQATAAERQGVHHNQEQNRFELSLDGADPAHADYRRDGDTLVFHHTYVPESARGQGHAATIVRAALDYARDNNFKVEPSCSYVAGYIERNPEYQPLKKEK